MVVAGARRRYLTSSVIVLAIFLTTCSPDGDAPPTLRSCPAPTGGDAPLPPDLPVKRVLAGSELIAVEPLLRPVEASLGINLEFEYVGSLEGAEKIASGADGFTFAWFGSSLYVQNAVDQPEARLHGLSSVARSPVILGVEHSVAAELGWADGNVRWQDVALAASEGRFRFAMTDPTRSNTGFSALVAADRALSTGGSPDGSTDAAALTRLFSGHKLTSRSSGFLKDDYLASQGKLDGLINYESVLLELNNDPALADRLDLVYPTEGVVIADYPLLLLDPREQEAFADLALALKTEAFQCTLAREAGLRPVIEGIDPGIPEFRQVPPEVSLRIASRDLDRLLFTYLDSARRPSTVVYILDQSGSMATDDRIGRLKNALLGLTGSDQSLTGRFSRFRVREKVILLPFSTRVGDAQVFEISSSLTGEPDFGPLRNAIQSLTPAGDTALFDALRRGVEIAAQERRANPDRFVSVVLLSDGIRTAGISFEEFNASLTEDLTGLPTFTIAFDAELIATQLPPTQAAEVAKAREALEGIAKRTGAEFVDASDGDLRNTFKTVRGSQ